MNMEELLDQLDEMLDRSMKIPGGKSLISIEKFRIIIDDIRLNVPQEIKQARGIVADRAEIIANAKKEAEGIIHAAEERARAMVAQEEITKLAQQKANETVAQAQAKSREMRKAAQDFVEEIMRRTDESLSANLSEVRKTRQALKPSVPPANRAE
ncbi:MAG: ATPase [Clostridia bacterium]|nr:ATPase [Clostridia bacterium]